MKYVSLDLETSSLIPSPGNILQIAMVFEDTEIDRPVEELNSFNRYIYKEEIIGSPRALTINAGLLAKLARSRRCDGIGMFNRYDPEDPSQTPNISELKMAIGEASIWLQNKRHLNGDKRLVAAGKNVGSFDLQFLPTVLRDHFKHRTVDPGSVFIDWSKAAPPGLGELLERFGSNRDVTHDALEDARDVIRVLRNDYGK